MARTSKRAKKKSSKSQLTQAQGAVQPGLATQPTVRPFAIVDQPGLYGLHNTYDRGYDAENQKHAVAGAGVHANDWNARLLDQRGEVIDLWIHDFDTSFEMGGYVAQSRYHRQFFPRNFAQPTVTVTGQVANTYEYNRLAAFVRRSHYFSLRADEYAAANMPGRQLGNGNAIPTVGLILRGGGIPALHNSKGPHKAWVLEGYIKSMPAGASHGEVAPQFKFDYIIAQSQYTATTGIYKDDLVAGSQLLTWTQIFEANHFSGGDKGGSYRANPVDDTLSTLAKAGGKIAAGDWIGGILEVAAGL